MKRVAVVYGGYSGEEVISRKSAAMVMNNIDQTVYSPTLIYIGLDGWYAEPHGERVAIDKNDFSFQLNGEVHRFDYAFVIIHGTPGEDGLLQGYFDMIGLKHTTGDTLNMALTFDKYVTNCFLRERGYNTARAVLLRRDKMWDPTAIAKELGFPCFVKPSRGGSSLGTFKCSDTDELTSSIEKAFEVASDIVVEEFIDGPEYTCGVIRIEGKTTALPVTEIVTGNDFFDFDAKYKGESNEITPAQIPEELTERIQDLSRDLWDLFDCKGMSRVDYLYQNDELYIIEINTVPGFSDVSIIPQQAAAMGINKKTLISLVLSE